MLPSEDMKFAWRFSIEKFGKLDSQILTFYLKVKNDFEMAHNAPEEHGSVA